MKGFTTIVLLLFSISGFAQAEGPLVGVRQSSCYEYILELVTRRDDTALEQMNKRLIKPNTSTIYVFKTEHVPSLPDSVNGYTVKCIDVEQNKDLVYEAQRDSNAVILYMNKMGWYGTRYNIVVIPAVIKRKGLFRKKQVGFEYWGYKVYFIHESTINKYRFEKTEYFDYTAEAGKA